MSKPADLIEWAARRRPYLQAQHDHDGLKVVVVRGGFNFGMALDLEFMSQPWRQQVADMLRRLRRFSKDAVAFRAIAKARSIAA